MALMKWVVAVAGLLQAIGHVAAHPAESIAHSTLLRRADDIRDSYDYIVVGGGTAGLTVADRLTESGRCESRFCVPGGQEAARLTVPSPHRFRTRHRARSLP